MNDTQCKVINDFSCSVSTQQFIFHLLKLSVKKVLFDIRSFTLLTLHPVPRVAHKAIFRSSSRSSVTEQHLIGPYMSDCLSCFS
jgi:hypothetical protein